jgi:hypothetical protein
MPPPHASTTCSTPAPAPKIASAIATIVSDMQATQEADTQRCVKRDKTSAALPTEIRKRDVGHRDGSRPVEGRACGDGGRNHTGLVETKSAIIGYIALGATAYE